MNNCLCREVIIHFPEYIHNVGQSAAGVICPAHTWCMNLHAKPRRGRTILDFVVNVFCIALLDFFLGTIYKAKIKYLS
jgi:hypothetical protein